MIGTRAALTMAVVGSLLTACGEVGSAADANITVDQQLFPYCAEARGALLELDWMTSGRRPVDTSTLDAGESRLRELAAKLSAPAEITRDVDHWDRAVQAWLDGIRAMPPRFENGRVVEPDTTALDAALVKDLRPVGQRLADWVLRVCGTP